MKKTPKKERKNRENELMKWSEVANCGYTEYIVQTRDMTVKARVIMRTVNDSEYCAMEAGNDEQRMLLWLVLI